MAGKGWVGVDADKTLFEYNSGSFRVDIFGKPIPQMVARIRMHIEDGDEVRLFTARVADPDWESRGKKAWEQISQYLFGTVLEATNIKDYEMVLLYDDKAVQIIPNTGELAIEVAVRKAYGDRKYAQRTES